MGILDAIFSRFARRLYCIKREISVYGDGCAFLHTSCYKILDLEYALALKSPGEKLPSCAPTRPPEVVVKIVRRFGNPAIALSWQNVTQPSHLRLEIKCLV